MSDETEVIEEEVEAGRQLVKAELNLDKSRGYIVPTNADEAYRMAQAVVRGNLAPDSYNRDPSKVVLGIMAALEAGLPPLYGLRQIAIINGRPSIWGDAAMALIQKSGQLVNQQMEWHVPEGFDPNTTHIGEWPDDYGVTVRLWRKGQADPYEHRFTVGDAKRAKLWMNAKKVPWIEHPRRMMMIRARAFCQRDGFADALAGLAIREEVEDTFEATRVTDTTFLADESAVEVPPMPETDDGPADNQS